MSIKPPPCIVYGAALISSVFVAAFFLGFSSFALGAVSSSSSLPASFFFAFFLLGLSS